MPAARAGRRAAAGIELSPAGGMLTAAEIIRLANMFVAAGVNKIRLTGGEPTVRPDIIEIVQVGPRRPPDD